MGITRGEIMDKVTLYAVESQDNWERVLAEPKSVIKEQLAIELPDNFKVNILVDTRDTMHFALPYVTQEGAELSDEDLESVAGGILDTTVNTCIVLSTGASAVVI